jgi:hypothetical protein
MGKQFVTMHTSECKAEGEAANIDKGDNTVAILTWWTSTLRERLV